MIINTKNARNRKNHIYYYTGSSLAYETGRIHTAKIQGSRRLKLSSLEAEGVDETLLVVGTRGSGSTRVVILGNGGVVGIGVLEVGNIGTVNLKFNLIIVGCDR